MEEPEERPRWSFTWLLRIQRTGRRRAREDERPAATSKVMIWVLIALVGIEVIVAYLLGVRLI